MPEPANKCMEILRMLVNLLNITGTADMVGTLAKREDAGDNVVKLNDAITEAKKFVMRGGR